MRSIDLYIDSIANRKNQDYFESRVCSSYESYQAGECSDNAKLPLGERLSHEM